MTANHKHTLSSNTTDWEFPAEELTGFIIFWSFLSSMLSEYRLGPW